MQQQHPLPCGLRTAVYQKSTLVPVSPVPSARLEMTFGTGLSLKKLLIIIC